MSQSLRDGRRRILTPTPGLCSREAEKEKDKPETVESPDDKEGEGGGRGGEGGPRDGKVQGGPPMSREETEDREEGTGKCRAKALSSGGVEVGAISGEAIRGWVIFRGSRSGEGK